MNEKLMAEDVLRPYGITLYYKGCEYLRDAIVLHWHRPDLKPVSSYSMLQTGKVLRRAVSSVPFPQFPV